MKGFVQSLSDTMLDKMDVVITFSKKEDGIYLLITPKNPKLEGLDLAGLTISGPAEEFDTMLESRLTTMPSATIAAIDRITEWEEMLGKNVTKKIESKKTDASPKKEEKKVEPKKPTVPNVDMFDDNSTSETVKPFVPNPPREDEIQEPEDESVDMDDTEEGTDEDDEPEEPIENTPPPPAEEKKTRAPRTKKVEPLIEPQVTTTVFDPPAGSVPQQETTEPSTGGTVLTQIQREMLLKEEPKHEPMPTFDEISNHITFEEKEPETLMPESDLAPDLDLF